MGKIRQIKRTHCDVEVAETALPADLRGWLSEQMEEAALLAHTDDGLVWGRVQDGKVRIVHDVFPDVFPLLREETLWQLWLFGPDTELYLWRDGDRWQRRLITEREGDEREYYDERQMLWGVYRQSSHDGFTLVDEGQQGLAHAAPLDVLPDAFDDQRHPLRLRLRHYLAEEPESGLLRVTLSRLVELYEEVQQ